MNFYRLDFYWFRLIEGFPIFLFSWFTFLCSFSWLVDCSENVEKGLIEKFVNWGVSINYEDASWIPGHSPQSHHLTSHWISFYREITQKFKNKKTRTRTRLASNSHWWLYIVLLEFKRLLINKKNEELIFTFFLNLFSQTEIFWCLFYGVRCWLWDSVLEFSDWSLAGILAFLLNFLNLTPV